MEDLYYFNLDYFELPDYMDQTEFKSIFGDKEKFAVRTAAIKQLGITFKKA